MKRKIIFFIIISFAFLGFMSNVLSDCTYSNPCCCADPVTHQKKCYTSGICCLQGMGNEYWDLDSCYNFKVWVEPASMMFTVGQQTPINLYIQNLAAYPDNFDINYLITNGSAALIQVDISGSTPVLNVNPMETKKVISPRITVLEQHATGTVLFNVSSQGDREIYKNATLRILQSDLPISLPEFDNLSLITMFILACIIYIVTLKKWSL
jgi:hypothetical protein